MSKSLEWKVGLAVGVLELVVNELRLAGKYVTATRVEEILKELKRD